MRRLLILIVIFSCAAAPVASEPYQVAGFIPSIATPSGKLDPNEVYACTVGDGHFQCIPIENWEAAKQANEQAADAAKNRTIRL